MAAHAFQKVEQALYTTRLQKCISGPKIKLFILFSKKIFNLSKLHSDCESSASTLSSTSRATNESQATNDSIFTHTVPLEKGREEVYNCLKGLTIEINIPEILMNM